MRKQGRGIHSTSFWAGFFSASFLFLLLLGGAGLLLATHGLVIQLDSEDVARLVKDRVVAQARQDLPNLIAGAKAEIPRVVEEEMRDQLTSDRMEIAGFVFRVPDELMEQLRRNMRENVEKATGEILDGINTNMVAEQFGENVYRMILEAIREEFHGQTFAIRAFGRIPLQVRVYTGEG